MSYRICFTIVLVAFAFMGKSQDVWSLEQCIVTAVQNSLAVENSDIQLQNAEINRKEATFAVLPNLNGNSSIFWNFGRSIDPTSNQFNTETFLSNNYSFNSGVVLFNGGRIRNNIKRNEIEVKVAELNKENVIRNLSLDVASAYLNALFRKENLTIAANNITATQQQIQELQRLITAGSRPRNDILNLESQLATNEQALIEAENNLLLSLLSLKLLMQIDPNTPMDVEAPEEVEMLTDPDLVDSGELFRMARLNQRSIQASELSILSSEMNEKITQAQFYPTLNLSGSFGTNYSNRGIEVIRFENQRVEQTIYFNNTATVIGVDQQFPVTAEKPYGSQFTDNLSYGFGFNLSVPLFNRWTTKSNVQRAKLNTESAKLNLRQEETTLQNSVQQSLADARAAKRAYNASQKAVDAQQNAFENTKTRFDLGSSTSFELSAQQATLDNARLNAVVSKYDYIFKTKILDFYLGKPLNLNQ